MSSIVPCPLSIVPCPSSASVALSTVRRPLLVVRHPLFIVRRSLSAVRRPSYIVGCPTFVVHRPPFAIVCRAVCTVPCTSCVVRRLPSIVRRPPSAVRRPSSIVRCSLSTIQRPPSAVLAYGSGTKLQERRARSLKLDITVPKQSTYLAPGSGHGHPLVRSITILAILKRPYDDTGFKPAGVGVVWASFKALAAHAEPSHPISILSRSIKQFRVVGRKSDGGTKANGPWGVDGCAKL